MNYKINISYDGTRFSGWQIQPEVRTVQKELQDTIQEIFKDNKIVLYGSGRTDAGVHANGQIANFIINTKMSTSQIKNAINSKINKDIYINGCQIIDENFNARFSALDREYIYKISKNFSPIHRKYTWYVSYKIDENKLDECAKIILGEHDFKYFCKTLSQKENNNCCIKKSKWKFKHDLIFYEIKANRFLHHMVRMLVGTMIEVSKNSISLDIFSNMINGKDIKPRIITCPAHGLFLNKVNY